MLDIENAITLRAIEMRNHSQLYTTLPAITDSKRLCAKLLVE